MATSWHCVAVGHFLSGAWTGEMATIGVRGWCRDAGGGAFGPNINAALEEFNASSASATGTTAHTNVTYGSEGSGGWSKANQGGIAEAMWTYLTALKSLQTVNYSWQEIRVSAITAANKVVNGASVFTFTAAMPGTTTPTVGMPPQSAIVASLQTGGRGPRNAGRIYLPIHSASSNIDGDGIITSSPRTTIRTATKTMIDTINALSGVRMAVVSNKHQTYSDITAVRTGDEVDSQAKRRNFRRETYTTTAVTS